MKILDGRKTVTSAGTAVQLASSAAVEQVIITVGSTTVVGAAGTRRGIGLAAGVSSPVIRTDDLADLWVDAVTSGEGVSWMAVTDE